MFLILFFYYFYYIFSMDSRIIGLFFFLNGLLCFFMLSKCPTLDTA